MLLDWGSKLEVKIISLHLLAVEKVVKTFYSQFGVAGDGNRR